MEMNLRSIFVILKSRAAGLTAQRGKKKCWNKSLRLSVGPQTSVHAHDLIAAPDLEFGTLFLVPSLPERGPKERPGKPTPLGLVQLTDRLCDACPPTALVSMCTSSNFITKVPRCHLCRFLSDCLMASLSSRPLVLWVWGFFCVAAGGYFLTDVSMQKPFKTCPPVTDTSWSVLAPGTRKAMSFLPHLPPPLRATKVSLLGWVLGICIAPGW